MSSGLWFLGISVTIAMLLLITLGILSFVGTPEERYYAKDLKAWRDRKNSEPPKQNPVSYRDSFAEPEGYDLPPTKPEYNNTSYEAYATEGMRPPPDRSWVTTTPINSINDIRSAMGLQGQVDEIDDPILILSFDGKVVRSYPKDILIEIARKISQDPTVILEEGAQITPIDRIPPYEPEYDDYPGFPNPYIRLNRPHIGDVKH